MSGYRVGGISPFGQMRNVKTAIEEQAIVHDFVYIKVASADWRCATRRTSESHCGAARRLILCVSAMAGLQIWRVPSKKNAAMTCHCGTLAWMRLADPSRCPGYFYADLVDRTGPGVGTVRNPNLEPALGRRGRSSTGQPPFSILFRARGDAISCAQLYDPDYRVPTPPL